MKTRERRYREAERALWKHVGVVPHEHWIDLPTSGARLRVQELGEGPRVLFIHPGGPNSGTTWALVASRLQHFRCLLVDRPGAGLSDPLRLKPAGIRRFGDRFVADVLDGLAVDRAALVCGSIGGYLALLSAASRPDRVSRMVQLGMAPFMPGGTIPPAMRILSMPVLWRLLARMPASDNGLRGVYDQFGHHETVMSGRIPPALWNYQLALQRYTDQAHNEYADIAAARVRRSPTGFAPELFLDRRLVQAVRAPYYLLAAPDDPFGGTDVAEGLVSLLPDAELEIASGVGHWPWLHDPAHCASVVDRFLGRRVHPTPEPPVPPSPTSPSSPTA
jgi:2-hydroxy-6-oxonona-2,4-dienedioate hydrolase